MSRVMASSIYMCPYDVENYFCACGFKILFNFVVAHIGLRVEGITSTLETKTKGRGHEFNNGE
jgi:hypothetical protein